jgi:hypothetical protein
MMVSARFPEAVCIFVQIDDVDQPMGPQPVVQDQVLKAPDDTDLATALAMISAGRQSADVGASLPVDLTAVMTPFRSSSPQPTTAAGETINLTIGIYQHMQTSDILAHWKVMQKDSVALARLTPILTQAKDITMLSVENVPDTAADQVCQDAAKTSSGCLAYY